MVKKARGNNGPALTKTSWTGPHRVVKQVGEKSDTIRTGRNEAAANTGQLKLALEAGGVVNRSVAGTVIPTIPQEVGPPPAAPEG